MPVQAPAGQASQISELGLLGRQELVWPFHVLFAMISHCAVSFSVHFNFIRFLNSALCTGLTFFLENTTVNNF